MYRPRFLAALLVCSALLAVAVCPNSLVAQPATVKDIEKLLAPIKATVDTINQNQTKTSREVEDLTKRVDKLTKAVVTLEKVREAGDEEGDGDLLRPWGGAFWPQAGRWDGAFSPDWRTEAWPGARRPLWLRGGGSLPKRWDLRDYIRAPLTVQFQYGARHAWAFAGLGAYEANYLYNGYGKTPTPSVQHIINCARARGGARDSTRAFEVLYYRGAPTRAKAPYLLGQVGSCWETSQQPLVYRAARFGVVPVATDKPLDDEKAETKRKEAVAQKRREAMQRALLQHGALVVGFQAGPVFRNLGYRSEYEVFADSEKGPINHYLTLIGWDNEKTSAESKKSGAWLVKNSWGTDWGEDGYMWIQYGLNGIEDIATWVEAWPSLDDGGALPASPFTPTPSAPDTDPLSSEIARRNQMWGAYSSYSRSPGWGTYPGYSPFPAWGGYPGSYPSAAWGLCPPGSMPSTSTFRMGR